MGGCRCTYRNCSVKTDGKTHMFHYPVFEKIRCHQWLVNAQRQDFLDLKLSQLKNRCVCQHHFTAESFMNYKKDKLTFDAVPTLDGPYCDPTKFSRAGAHQEYPISILVEDIENDFDINDKKSNFSIKYGDFLLNNEFTDSSARYNRNNINLDKDNSDKNVITSLHSKNKKKVVPEPQKKNLSLPAKKVKTILPQHVRVPPYSDLSNELKMGKQLNLEQNVIDLNSNLNQVSRHTLPEFTVGLSVPPIQADNVENPVIVKIQPKVNIISEEKIKDLMDIAHINITGKFEKVSPSKPLCLTDKKFVLDQDVKVPVITPHKKIVLDNDCKEPVIIPHEKIVLDKDIKETVIMPHKNIVLNKDVKVPVIMPHKNIVLNKDVKETVIMSHKNIVLDKDVKEPVITPQSLKLEPPDTMHSKLKVLDILNVDFEPEIPKIQKVQQEENKATRDELPQSPPKKSVQVKTKVTPERIAAIEKKRQFNMKLKDIIESCLDQLDDPVKNYETSTGHNKLENPIDEINKINEPMKQIKTNRPEEKVVSVIKKENGQSSAHDSTIAYLEERMKQMENTLLNKIAQNSQEIIAFKNTWSKEPVVSKRKEKTNKRCASTQTNENTTVYKKFLYQEISKYLSPSANSVIYEELFINKYSCQVKSPRRKRRKCS